MRHLLVVLGASFLAGFFPSSLARADTLIYGDSLSPGWDSWSWSGVYDFADPSMTYTGAHSIFAEAEGFGAVSLHSDTPFAASGALRFYLEGDDPPLALMLEADGEGYASPPVEILDWVEVEGGVFTEVVIPLEDFESHEYTRIDFMNNSFDPVTFHLDQIEFLDEIPTEDGFTAAEPIGMRRILLLGTGDVEEVTVSLNGVELPVVGSTSVANPSRTYLELGADLDSGEVVIAAPGGTFTRSLRGVEASLGDAPTHSISPLIYGMSFPSDEEVLGEQGVPLARWGGNSTSQYNPFLGATNLAFDWFFENSPSDDADAWMGAMATRGAIPFLSVPALPYVAKDSTSYGYSVSLYGAQQETDPWKPDAGNGRTPGGVAITWNDPQDAGTPWGVEDAREWLAGLENLPGYVAIDNEMDIWSGTHTSVHPQPQTYEGILSSILAYGAMVKEELPGAVLAAPSSCCWWFYWNSAAGEEDKTDHGGEDFFPWFLERMAEEEMETGQRILDVFDIHYYPDGGYGYGDSSLERARRLRATRSLWDPTYTDEGWIGVDEWATETQPDRNQVQLIPRMKALLAEHYPGTGFGIGEWSLGADRDISGGLATADALGILGREGVDFAAYWAGPQAGSHTAAAFSLMRGGTTPFGSESLPVTAPEPDLLGVYAARGEKGVVTLLVVNKDPDRDLVLHLSGLPAGARIARRFGGGLEAQVVEDPEEEGVETLVIPAYGAVLMATGGEEPGDDDTPEDDDTPGDNDTPGDDDTGSDDDTAGGDDDQAEDDEGEPGGCGCQSGGGEKAPGLGVVMGMGLMLGRKRRGRAHHSAACV